MEVETVLVTGANRGIGLEFVKQFVQLPNPPRLIFATYRDENTIQDLKQIKDESEKTQVVLIKMDITKEKEIEDAKKIVEDIAGDKGLNLLINNAGVAKLQGFPDITQDNLLFHFTTNTVGPVMILKAIYPLLQKAAALKSSGMNVSRSAVLNISAELGSISQLKPSDDKFSLMPLGYRTSKVALNMAMRVIALTVQDQGILVVSMCPGWVKTDMGSPIAMLEVSESISDMMKTMSQLNETHNGSFLDRKGKTIPF
ncbi:uncharacterized protein CDAR_595991 [Caerostris darwini]|uniref:C-factor n=1 Tax=Caerostris darwini TaxID=1538125 RepID=A0AAV4SEF1_9ARAC|nr:uncharacterized protein CDAR_595991 [Caerostris darwini]